jgi:hypothetical protein
MGEGRWKQKGERRFNHRDTESTEETIFYKIGRYRFYKIPPQAGPAAQFAKRGAFGAEREDVSGGLTAWGGSCFHLPSSRFHLSIVFSPCRGQSDLILRENGRVLGRLPP